MWKPYLRTDRASTARTALNILDRFHVVAKMNQALDEVRAREARRMVRDGYEPVLKKIALVLAQAHGESHRASSASGCATLLRYNLQSVRAYLLKEDFQQFWDYDSPTWAGKFLDRWCTKPCARTSNR